MSLANKNIASVKPKITYIAGQLTNLTKQQVEQLISAILRDTLFLVKMDVRRWVELYVPYRTGQLQQNILDNFESSFSDAEQLKIYLGANVDHARFVNKMDQSNVQHSAEIGYAYYNGYHGKIMLNDPTAQGHFFGIMVMYARDRLRFHLSNVKSAYIGSVGVAAKPFQQMKVTT